MPRLTLPPATPEEVVLQELIDAEFQPDRAHHDELGRTANGDEEPEVSPREQPAEAIDLERVDE
jgi:hypothetical protein